MTTVCIDNNYLMASDTRSTKRGIKIPREVQKIFRFGEYRVGIAGELSPAIEMINLIRKDLKKGKYNFNNTQPLEDNFSIIAIKDGDDFLRVYISKVGFWEIDGIPFAMGSGADFALGAMYHGANASEAVGIASKLDVFTGDTIHELPTR